MAFDKPFRGSLFYFTADVLFVSVRKHFYPLIAHKNDAYIGISLNYLKSIRVDNRIGECIREIYFLIKINIKLNC